MSKSYRIDGELIKSSGSKLRNIGYFIIGMVVLQTIYILVLTQSNDIETITGMGTLTYVVMIIFSIMVIVNIIQSGNHLEDSIQILYEDGEYVEYFTDDRIKEKGTIVNGLKNGDWVTYYESGQLKSRGIFKDGKEDGVWDTYDISGQLYQKTFKDGVRVK
jgi:hypothetical protein